MRWGGLNGRQGTPPGSDGTECRSEKGAGRVETGGQVVEGEGEGRGQWRSPKTSYLDSTTVTSEGSTPVHPVKGRMEPSNQAWADVKIPDFPEAIEGDTHYGERCSSTRLGST